MKEIQMRPTLATKTAQTGPLSGQTVVIIGGSSGMGLATAGQAKAAGADLVLTGRDHARLERAAHEVGALRSARLDLGEPGGLESFFAELPASIDHILVTGGGPMYVPIADLDFDAALNVLDEHLLGALRVARVSAGRVRPGGSLTFITGTDARRPNVGSSVAAILAAAMPAVVANIAVELAPIRANAVAAGYVDTPLSARILGGDLERRRAELRATLPIRRVVGPADIAATVVHLMTNTAVTGATYDVDGGQQVLS
jgi:NAD(P)-dependent dehydrogenase (short-subunit alcohol dehydrogenase family)